MRLADELNLKLYDQSYDGRVVNILNYNSVTYTSSPINLIFTSFFMAYDLVKGLKQVSADNFSPKI